MVKLTVVEFNAVVIASVLFALFLIPFACMIPYSRIVGFLYRTEMDPLQIQDGRGQVLSEVVERALEED